MKTRREFLTTTVYGLGAIGILASDRAQAQTMVSETDPQAVALGYKTNTNQVDQKKYPKHTAEQKCSNCQLFQSKSASNGSCAIFAGKLVPVTGWCSTYQKKA